MAKLRLLLAITLCAFAGACGDAPGIAGHIETLDQRIKRQEAEFNASPDVKDGELRARLHALGVKDGWMKPALEENGVEILQLRVPRTDFARLDKRALAKLVLDSRYRFEFVDNGQIHEFALYQGAETHARDKKKALAELAEWGQVDSFPRYREGVDLATFAPRLEAWCGYKKGQALRVVDGYWVDYQHSMVDLAVEDKDGRASASFDCMKRVVDATTELRRRFTGNRGREGAIDY